MYNNHFELAGDDNFINFPVDFNQSHFPYVNSCSNRQCQNTDVEVPIQQQLFSKYLLPKQTQRRKKKKQEETILQNKQNSKNAYINKISSLIQESVPTTAPKLEKKVSNFQDDSTQAKLLRNRESAKNSRKRKKIYLELLENRVNTLKDELEKCKKIIKDHSNCMLLIGSNSQQKACQEDRQKLFDKLKSAIQDNSDNNDINLLLDTIKFKFGGGGGKERVNDANYVLQQVMEIFPIHVKYLLWGSDSILTQPSWFTDLNREVDISDYQMRSLNQSYQRIQYDKQKIEDIIEQLQTVKVNLYQKTYSFGNFIDELRNIFTPTQVSKLILGLEKNKYSKEFSVLNMQKQFEDEFDTIDKQEEWQFDDTVSKKIHI
ncbi:unnamed protein product [Paramecium octaurelia]|uniref:BZIP domain-containing protein n=1 Tax=Paramecium octaurelia TaxID=43137 RepID=A0A8S1X120_PAROT|nr:unnamed protein product [Paramecium octaurelia]